MIIHKNVLLIIIAFSFATLLWLQYNLSREQYAIISLPVDYVSTSGDTLIKNLPAKLRFKVKGSGFDLIKLFLTGIRVQYTGVLLKNDVTDFDVADFHLDNPSASNIFILELLSNVKNINAEKNIKKAVNIQLEFADKSIQQSFSKSIYKLSPENVIISGPERAVNAINFISTQTISSNQLNEDKLRLKLTSPSSLVNLDPTSVDVIRYNTGYTTRILTNLIIQGDYSFRYFPNTVSIRVGGNTNLINNLTSENVTVNLDLSQENDEGIPLKIILPKDISLLDYSPRIINRTAHNDSN